MCTLSSDRRIRRFSSLEWKGSALTDPRSPGRRYMSKEIRASVLFLGRPGRSPCGGPGSRDAVIPRNRGGTWRQEDHRPPRRCVNRRNSTSRAIFQKLCRSWSGGSLGHPFSAWRPACRVCLPESTKEERLVPHDYARSWKVLGYDIFQTREIKFVSCYCSARARTVVTLSPLALDSGNMRFTLRTEHRTTGHESVRSSTGYIYWKTLTIILFNISRRVHREWDNRFTMK